MATDTATNHNGERADQAARAITLPPCDRNGSDDQVVRLLADLRHLSDRDQIVFSECEDRADRLYAVELSEHHSAQGTRFTGARARPIEVITFGARAVSRYRADVDDILGEFVQDDEDILLGLWALLIEALQTGQASEEDGIPPRTFLVDEHKRPALAAQLMIIREEAIKNGLRADAFAEPDADLASFLP
jgi:hypothetical protein